MASNSETGNAKNVSNLQELIAFVVGYGTQYKPSKPALKLVNLNALLLTAQTSLAEVITKNTAYNNAINNRMLVFENLSKLSTRLINAIETTDASIEKIKDAKSFNRKLQGKRASKPAIPIDLNTPAPTTISVSQQSYNQKIQHLAGLISVLQSESSYAPNEIDLKITTLNTLQTTLALNNAAVATAHVNISNSRLNRNNILYTENTGLVNIANYVKKYIKSVFGASSPEYDQIKGISFKKITN